MIRFLGLVVTLALMLPCTAAAVLYDNPADFIAAELPDWIDKPKVETALVDAGTNWGELADALTMLVAENPLERAGSKLSNALWLVNNAPHLDRLELTTEILLDTVNLASTAAAEHGYDTASVFYRRNVLNYRLDDEPVTNWRPVLQSSYSKLTGRSLPQLENITALVNYATAGFKVVERGYYGNLAAPVSIHNSRAGTRRELALLTAAALRSVGFATRFVKENRSGESWVEVYTGPAADYDPAAWTPVYPQAPDQTGNPGYAMDLCGGRIAVVTAGDAFGREQVTARYSEVCGVRPVFLDNSEPQQNFEHWTITAWGSGTYAPLDDLGYPTADVDYPLTLGPEAGSFEGEVYFVGAPGDYRLQAGVRYPGGVVHVVTSDFTASPGGLVEVELSLDAPVDLPMQALIERRLPAELPDGVEWLAQGTHLIVVVDNAEPSVRTLGLLEGIAASPDLDYITYSMPEADESTLALLRDVMKIKDADQLPVVILVRDGETLLYQRGYNLNIADWVSRALDG